MVRIGATMGVPEVLHSLGANPRTVLSEAGFDIGLFDNPDNLIAYAARGRLLAHCAVQTNCEHFGLLVGQRSGLTSLGLVGLLVAQSPNVGTALQNLVRYLHLHVRGAATTLSVDGGVAMLGYQVYQRGAKANDQVSAGAVAVIYNILRELCGPDWKPIEAWFMHRKPENVEPFRRFFRVLLRFDAEQNALVFSSSWLKRPLPEARPELRRLVQEHIDALEAQYGDDFPAQVRAVLRATLATGDATGERVAALFSMHHRTLNRRLNAYGTCFQELVDEISLAMARQMLNDSDLAVSEIALLLHYADARSFIRAFQRWCGVTPARWRETQKRLRRASLAQPRPRTPLPPVG
jgi:AraC-like DNA-binding protein